jgi:hypothetical protein
MVNLKNSPSLIFEFDRKMNFRVTIWHILHTTTNKARIQNSRSIRVNISSNADSKPPFPQRPVARVLCYRSSEDVFSLILSCKVKSNQSRPKKSINKQPHMESFVVSNQSVQCHSELNFCASYLSPPHYQSYQFSQPRTFVACLCADEIKGGYQLVAVKRLSSTEVRNLEEWFSMCCWETPRETQDTSSCASPLERESKKGSVFTSRKDGRRSHGRSRRRLSCRHLSG